MTRDTTRREATRTETTGSTETLGDVSHTDPYTDRSFGSTQVYDRGKLVAADGGAPAEGDGRTDDESADGDAAADGGRRGSGEGVDAERIEDAERLADVDHTPPKNAESANRVHERGREGKDGTV